MSCSRRSSGISGERRCRPARRRRPTLRGSLLLPLALLAAWIPGGPAAQAQRSEPALSDAEVEQLRESAYIPADRLGVFIKILDTRARSLGDLLAKPRRPGRDQDIHDMLEQFTAIADELNDNLDDYGPRHRDLRRQLPKLVEATDRWATVLRTPAENEAYNVSKRLALESVRDVHQEAVRLVDEQRTFFSAHPDAAKAEKQRESNEPASGPVAPPH